MAVNEKKSMFRYMLKKIRELVQGMSTLCVSNKTHLFYVTVKMYFTVFILSVCPVSFPPCLSISLLCSHLS